MEVFINPFQGIMLIYQVPVCMEFILLQSRSHSTSIPTEHVATDRFCENSAAWLIKTSSTGK